VEINTAQVRAARALLNWNQADLAVAAEISLPTVKRYESGTRTPLPTMLAAIRRALEEAGVIFENDGKFVGVKLKIKRGK
jgi:transcriptional regulator with XRE-family HTH domain